VSKSPVSAYSARPAGILIARGILKRVLPTPVGTAEGQVETFYEKGPKIYILPLGTALRIVWRWGLFGKEDARDHKDETEVGVMFSDTNPRGRIRKLECESVAPACSNIQAPQRRT
jgi:hypothetical protein